MYRRKFFVVLMMFAGLLMMGCNKDKDKDRDPEWDDLSTIPWSKLTPDKQKVKLEQETIKLLNELQAASSLKAIDVFEYFSDLLDRASPDVTDPYKKQPGSSVAEKYLFDLANTYGVFTWNPSGNMGKGSWTKASSITELKFVFPSDSKKTTNNASFTMKSTNSSSTVTSQYWYHNCDYPNCTEELRQDLYKLPSTASGILALDGTNIAVIEIGIEYENVGKIDMEDDEFIEGSAPVKTKLLVTTPEGYSFGYDLDGKGKDTKFEMHVTKGKSVLVEALYKMNIDLSEIFDEAVNTDDIEDIFDLDWKINANGHFRMTDDISLLYVINVAKFAEEIYDITNWEEPDWDRSDYYSKLGQLKRKESDDLAAAYSKYMQIALVSKKEGTKIADMIFQSKKDGEYWDYFVWRNNRWEWGTTQTKKYDKYAPVPFLKFGDGTLVEAEVYFSSGFGKLEERWEDFVKAFER